MSTPTNSGNGYCAGNRPPLTDEQKKMNHIASEQQRRQTIRGVFDQLSELVPGMQGEARSEAKVLQATVDYMRAQLAKKEELKAKMLAKGWSEEKIESYYQPAESDLVDDDGGGATEKSDAKDDAMPIDGKKDEGT